MDEREFFDKLYQMWANTTGAQDRYWDYQKDGKDYFFNINAVGEDGDGKFVASVLLDEDADFITAIHGCFPDLIRTVLAALDEADRADFDKDSRECRIAELESALAEAQAGLAELRADSEGLIAG
jgi:hypothetical protein